MGVTQKSWFRRNRFCRVTPAQFIRYLKSFYKANLDINKLLRLWVLIWTLSNFRTFGSNPLYFYNFIRYLQKIQLLTFHTLVLLNTTFHSHYFLGNTLKFLSIIRKEQLKDIYFKRNINLQVALSYFNLIFYNLNNYTRHNNLIKRGFIYVFSD